MRGAGPLGMPSRGLGDRDRLPGRAEFQGDCLRHIGVPPAWLVQTIREIRERGASREAERPNPVGKQRHHLVRRDCCLMSFLHRFTPNCGSNEGHVSERPTVGSMAAREEHFAGAF